MPVFDCQSTERNVEIFLSNGQKWSIGSRAEVKKVVLKNNYLYLVPSAGPITVYEIKKLTTEYVLSENPFLVRACVDNDNVNFDFAVDVSGFYLVCKIKYELKLIMWKNFKDVGTAVDCQTIFPEFTMKRKILTDMIPNCITFRILPDPNEFIPIAFVPLYGGPNLHTTPTYANMETLIHFNTTTGATQFEYVPCKGTIFWYRKTEVQPDYEDESPEIITNVALLQNSQSGNFLKVVKCDGVYTTDRCIFKDIVRNNIESLSLREPRFQMFLVELGKFKNEENFDHYLEKFYIYSCKTKYIPVDANGKFAVHPKKSKAKNQQYELFNLLTEKTIGKPFTPTPNIYMWQILDCEFIEMPTMIMPIYIKNIPDVFFIFQH